MSVIDSLFPRVKANLILEHDEDDDLLGLFTPLFSP